MLVGMECGEQQEATRENAVGQVCEKTLKFILCRRGRIGYDQWEKEWGFNKSNHKS